MSIPPLFKNQAESIEFEKAHARMCDFSDPGTGKTRSRIESFAARRVNGGKCALVLCSKSLMYSAWFTDARRYTPWLTVSLAYASNRQKAFEKRADMYVTNHDAAKWLAKQPDSFFDKFDTLIIDESPAFKHHTSQRSKAVAKIKRFFPHRSVMTGTPNTNTVLDIWHQVNIVDDGQRLGRSFYAFRNVVCAPRQVGPSARMLKWEDRDGAEEAVTDKIADITLRYKLSECHDIPANHKYIVPLQISAKLREQYEEMERLAVMELKSGAVISAVNAAAVVTKLLQICSGAVYDSEGTYHLLDRARYELVADLAEECRHSVVFFNWKHQRDELVREFEARDITFAVIDGAASTGARSRAVESFQAGMLRVILAHPQSAAHGLTLTRGTRTIWSSPTYNLEHWIQGNHRIDRAGQTQKTETVNVIAEGTIEEHVYAVLNGKRARLENMLEYLKDKTRRTHAGTDVEGQDGDVLLRETRGQEA